MREENDKANLEAMKNKYNKQLKQVNNSIKVLQKELKHTKRGEKLYNNNLICSQENNRIKVSLEKKK